MGILNVTPDSFFDGGLHIDAGAAARRAEEMVAEGADLIDVGGESTRPGATPVAEEEERRRVVSVVRAAARLGVPVSIDTSKASVAAAALEAGASVVNDVTALGDPHMARTVAAAGAGLVLMHMRGTPRTMQDDPRYDDVVAEVGASLAARVEVALAAGIGADRIAVDPGIGFGKTLAHNLALLRGLPDVSAAIDPTLPVVVGASRKSFLGRLGAGDRPADRLAGSLAAAVAAALAGAAVVRAHDVLETRRALAIADALRSAPEVP